MSSLSALFESHPLNSSAILAVLKSSILCLMLPQIAQIAIEVPAVPMASDTCLTIRIPFLVWNSVMILAAAGLPTLQYCPSKTLALAF